MTAIVTRSFVWSWDGCPLSVGVDEQGDGPPILCLPAPSSISTRGELHALIGELAGAGAGRLVVPDWPGFGDEPRPAIRWSPAALSAFLSDFADRELRSLHATIAAGHAATYALDLTVRQPGRLGRLVLLAPTWRGPLPTAFGGDRPLLRRLQRAIEAPVVGPLLYRLNVNPLMARMMVAGHVYSRTRPLTGGQRAVMRAPGARFASGAFVTGGLDLLGSRDAFLDLARRARVPILVAYGRDTPPKSRAEMEALASLPEVSSVVLPHGKLGIHEEFAAALAPSLLRFLA
ncbi:MAG TPA: alpha/beta hydrolase [Acetobacteraceae bacterium]|jgi:pimeloyl-ACP methyl ester carboxylesterase|nr:alpha/beta hydrolase [Acetobacteraceae bacterium]